MAVNLVKTRNYSNEQRTMNNELLFKTNPTCRGVASGEAGSNPTCSELACGEQGRTVEPISKAKKRKRLRGRMMPGPRSCSESMQR